MAIKSVTGAWAWNGSAWKVVNSLTADMWSWNGSAWKSAVSADVFDDVDSHYHEVVPSGGDVQAAMDRASAFHLANQSLPVDYSSEATMACVELVENGVYTLTTNLHYRRGVRLIGAGSGATRPIIRGTASHGHLFTNDDNGGGGYNSPHTDWLIKNVAFDCDDKVGGFSIVHTKRFQIDGCDFKDLKGFAHYIEINSSGGAVESGTYNCQVINCTFSMNNNPVGRRTEDECIQLDYSWSGAASNVANDGTCTNNVRIAGCSFTSAPRAIGGHHFEAGSGGEADPVGIHTNILIEWNTFTDINPDLYGDGANSNASEGAVRFYVWRSVVCAHNTFTACLEPINGYIPGDCFDLGNTGPYTVALNTIIDKTSTRSGIVFDAQSPTVRHGQVLVSSNTVQGAWGGSDYFVECLWTAGTVSGYSTGVVITGNMFKPSGMSLANEKAYNKYRAASSTYNATGVTLTDNTVSDGSVDNS